MKACWFWLLPLLVLVFGCEYGVPVIEEAEKPVNEELLGLWERFPDGENRLMVLKLSGTEYLIHHPADGKGIYYRGYEVEVDGKPLIQLEGLGTHTGPVEADLEQRYHVVRVEVGEERLNVGYLNSKVVEWEVDSSADLREAIQAHWEDPELFRTLGAFRRVEAEE